MTQESINDLVKSAANKIKSIFGDTPTAHIFPAGFRVNIETGETVTLPPRKGDDKTTSESFFSLFSMVLYQRYLFDIEAYINAGLSKDLLLIDLKDKWIEHQREADSLLLEQKELEYFLEYNPDELVSVEHCKKELTPCQFDQIREQLYADFYKLAIGDLTTQNQPQKPHLQNAVAFFIAIYVLGLLGIVKEFPFDGTSTNAVKEKVTAAAKEAMSKFGGNYNIATLHAYLRDNKTSFKNHLPQVETFLLYHYPEDKIRIQSILGNLREKLTR